MSFFSTEKTLHLCLCNNLRLLRAFLLFYMIMLGGVGLKSFLEYSYPIGYINLSDGSAIVFLSIDVFLKDSPSDFLNFSEGLGDLLREIWSDLKD